MKKCIMTKTYAKIECRGKNRVNLVDKLRLVAGESFSPTDALYESAKIMPVKLHIIRGLRQFIDIVRIVAITVKIFGIFLSFP